MLSNAAEGAQPVRDETGTRTQAVQQQNPPSPHPRVNALCSHTLSSETRASVSLLHWAPVNSQGLKPGWTMQP